MNSQLHNKSFDDIIKEYIGFVENKTVSPVSFSKEESKKSFNYDIAVQIFGSEFVDQLSQELKASYLTHQYKFTGDWCIYSFLKYIIETDQIEAWNELKINGDLHDGRDVDKRVQLHLEGAVFNDVKLNGIKLRYAHLSNSLFYNVHLENVELIDVQFNNSKFSGVYLPRAYLQGVNFANSKWSRINLRNARIFNSNLAGLTCQYIDITDKTEFNECNLNSTSIFENTSLGVIKNNKVKSQLTYAIRRFKWEKWYHEEMEDKAKDSIKYKLLRLFWYCSDYGYSTKRIVGSFMITASFFAFLYWSVGVYDFLAHGDVDPCWGMVEGLFQLNGQTLMSPLSFTAVIRSFYFSVVTMTTLGFGDIYARYNNILGHIVLGIQVIIGYVLLAVLVTRMSVLFSNDGPTYIPIKSARHKQNDIAIFYKWSAILVIMSCIILALEILTNHNI